jgi:hypothetical protein
MGTGGGNARFKFFSEIHVVFGRAADHALLTTNLH